MKTKRHYNKNKRQKGGAIQKITLPGDTEPTIYDDAVDPFSSPESSPSEDEIMRANETKRRWVKQTKKQRAAKTAPTYAPFIAALYA